VVFQSNLVISKRSAPRWACVVDVVAGWICIRKNENKLQPFRLAVVFQSNLVISKRSAPRWACVVDVVAGWICIRKNENKLQPFRLAVVFQSCLAQINALVALPSSLVISKGLMNYG
jgi:hypothetical protein